MLQNKKLVFIGEFSQEEKNKITKVMNESNLFDEDDEILLPGATSYFIRKEDEYFYIKKNKLLHITVFSYYI